MSKNNNATAQLAIPAFILLQIFMATNAAATVDKVEYLSEIPEGTVLRVQSKFSVKAAGVKGAAHSRRFQYGDVIERIGSLYDFHCEFAVDNAPQKLRFIDKQDFIVTDIETSLNSKEDGINESETLVHLKTKPNLGNPKITCWFEHEGLGGSNDIPLTGFYEAIGGYFKLLDPSKVEEQSANTPTIPASPATVASGPSANNKNAPKSATKLTQLTGIEYLSEIPEGTVLRVQSKFSVKAAGVKGAAHSRRFQYGDVIERIGSLYDFHCEFAVDNAPQKLRFIDTQDFIVTDIETSLNSKEDGINESETLVHLKTKPNLGDPKITCWFEHEGLGGSHDIPLTGFYEAIGGYFQFLKSE